MEVEVAYTAAAQRQRLLPLHCCPFTAAPSLLPLHCNLMQRERVTLTADDGSTRGRLRSDSTPPAAAACGCACCVGCRGGRGGGLRWATGGGGAE